MNIAPVKHGDWTITISQQTPTKKYKAWLAVARLERDNKVLGFNVEGQSADDALARAVKHIDHWRSE